MPNVTLNITGTVNDTDGNSAPFSAQAMQAATDVVTIVSATVSPASAAPGTVRTLTVVATSSLGETLSASVSADQPVTFTSVPGQPAGTFAWTFTW